MSSDISGPFYDYLKYISYIQLLSFSYRHFSKYLLLFSAEEEEKSYRFGITLEQNFHFWVNYPFKTSQYMQV